MSKAIRRPAVQQNEPPVMARVSRLRLQLASTMRTRIIQLRAVILFTEAHDYNYKGFHLPVRVQEDRSTEPGSAFFHLEQARLESSIPGPEHERAEKQRYRRSDRDGFAANVR